MNTELNHTKKIDALREKLQRDVDLILETFLGYSTREDIFEDHFDVDAILKSKISMKQFGKVNHKNNSRVSAEYSVHAHRGIDSTMDPVDPLFYERRNRSQNSSVLRKVADATQNLLGIIF